VKPVQQMFDLRIRHCQVAVGKTLYRRGSALTEAVLRQKFIQSRYQTAMISRHVSN